MTIARLDHFTLRTRRLDETTAFFVDVLGLHIGPRPAFPFPGAWLYLDDRPVVHLAEATDSDDSGLSGYLGATGDLGARGRWTMSRFDAPVTLRSCSASALSA